MHRTLLPVAVAAADSIWEQYPDYNAMWLEFKATFRKDYPGPEDAERFRVFQASVREVRAVNARNLTYTFALTRFSDLLPEELRALSGGAGRHGPVPREDAYVGRHVWEGERLPAAVDWTAQGAVTPAKDQKICGSCWAFSAAASLEGAQALASGRLVSLSEQQAMQCGSPDGRGCEGGWPDNVFKYAAASQDDLCTEESYPYEGVDTIPCFWNDPEHSSCSPAVKKGEVVGYRDVEQTMEAMMSAVAQQPISVAVGGSGHWGQYHGGVFTDCDVGVGHAVTVVGYGETGGEKYWKLKNSWGPDFGLNGYILIGRDRGVPEGECGLFAHASYPVMAASSSTALQV